MAGDKLLRRRKYSCGAAALQSERRREDLSRKMASSSEACGWRRQGRGRRDGDAMVDDERWP
jgi:hypothetical protein